MKQSEIETSLHPLLLRQLGRSGIASLGTEFVSTTEVRRLLEKVSDCYRNAEEDRELLERSIDLSSREMESLNRRLETDRNRLSTLLTTTEDCIFTLNGRGEVIWANPAALSLFGAEKTQNTRAEEPFAFFDNVESLPADDCTSIDRNQNTRHCRGLLRNRAGIVLPISYLANKINAEKEDDEALIIVLRDITTELAHEKDLRNAREVANAANVAKSELLANVSHEVRTPLHGIIGMADVLLSEGSLNHNQIECLQNLQVSAKSLLHVLNDILDISKIEAGRLSMEEIPFSPEAVLRQVHQFMQVQAAAKGLNLYCRVEPQCSYSVLGDPTRLRQILLNLVGNAIKFTEQGSVELSLCSAVVSESVTLDFQVRDTGIGIPVEQHKTIFEAFTQADGSITRRFGGTGLGLTICSRLARLMESELTVESAPGSGSTFRFTLSLKVAPPSNPEILAEVALAPVRILYAEDNVINQLTGRKMLRSRGHSVHIVPNGRTAVEAWKQEDYDVILMDHQMPEMSGIEASLALRALGCKLPIIAASANAMREDRERFTAAGMDGFVGKPFTIAELEREIGRLAGCQLPERMSLVALHHSPSQKKNEEAIENINGDTKTFLPGPIPDSHLRSTPHLWMP